MKLEDFLAPMLEKALNTYIQLDPDAVAGLDEIAGKWIAIELIGLDVRLYILSSVDGFKVRARRERWPDTVIRGSPFELFRTGFGGSATRRDGDGRLQIQGDVEIGRLFRDVLFAVDIDWEELLANQVGDIAAHQIGNSVRGFKAWMSRAQNSLRMDVTEYLQEESRLTPTRLEIEAFLDEVDELRSDVDRLEARVNRISTHLDKVHRSDDRKQDIE